MSISSPLARRLPGLSLTALVFTLLLGSPLAAEKPTEPTRGSLRACADGQVYAHGACHKRDDCGAPGQRSCLMVERDEIGVAPCERGAASLAGRCVPREKAQGAWSGSAGLSALARNDTSFGDDAGGMALEIAASLSEGKYGQAPPTTESEPAQEPERTCADITAPGTCVEVWPGQDGAGYDYDPNHRAYYFRNLSNANHYFLLMGDLSCDGSCALFGFDDATPDGLYRTVFDLNGFDVLYSDLDYPKMPNAGFELWSGNQPVDWTVISGAVERRSTQQYHPMRGDWLLYTPGGAQLESPLVSLPKARSYNGFVTVGKTDINAAVTVEVLDASGNTVCSGVTQSEFGYLRGETVSCRFDAPAPGSYKLRVSSGGYAYFDHSGIVPLADYGVASVFSSDRSSGTALAYNLQGANVPYSRSTSGSSLRNHLEVFGGTIETEHENQKSYGVYIRGEVTAYLHDTTVIAKGIKSHSFHGEGEIHDNTLLVDMPWYFRRQETYEANVILEGGKFFDNVAIGGHGVVRLRGTNTEVYNNYLANDSQATNHYTVMHSSAVSPKIYSNFFDPIEGSGILTYTGAGYEIHNNVFHIQAAPCNVEYVNEDYSTNGIRINDYGSGQSVNNRVYDNVFHIESDYEETAWPDCMPIATGIFYSASGANNRVFSNTFHITKMDATEMAPAFGIYVGDATNNPATNPLFTDNTFITNDKAIWISSPYGETDNMWFEENTYIRVENPYYTPQVAESAIRIGHSNDSAHNVRMINDRFVGFDPDALHVTGQWGSPTFDLTRSWRADVTVLDESGSPLSNAQVTLSSNPIAGYSASGNTDAYGRATITVVGYVESGDLRPDGTRQRTDYSPFRLQVTAGTTTVVDPVMIEGPSTMTVERGTGLTSGSICPSCLDELVVDNDDPGTSSNGNWASSSYYPGYYGAGYLYSTPETQSGLWFEWTANLAPGPYEVSARWPDTGSGRPTDVTYEVTHTGGTDTVTAVDQNLAGGAWHSLGTYNFGSNATVRVISGSTGHQGTAADAVRFRQACPSSPEAIDTLEFQEDRATISWYAPDSGGVGVTYDSLRSNTGRDFVTDATCLEEDDGTDEILYDASVPDTDHAYFYMVRTENLCGVAMGEATRPRSALRCPDSGE